MANKASVTIRTVRRSDTSCPCGDVVELPDGRRYKVMRADADPDRVASSDRAQRAAGYGGVDHWHKLERVEA